MNVRSWNGVGFYSLIETGLIRGGLNEALPTGSAKVPKMTGDSARLLQQRLGGGCG
jgi:hypothetical protein